VLIMSPNAANSQPADLKDLMIHIARGDSSAFAELYRATSPQLFALALRMMRKKELAEEVLQEVYVTIWTKAHVFDSAKGAPLAWIARIMRNRCLDRLSLRRPEKSIEDEPSASEWADTAPGPLDEALRSADARALKLCLDGLEHGPRDAILRIYYEGLTHAELAELTSVPLGTVKSWVRRGLMRLKDCLDR
jgi:RNA polymerase sigma-70 factor (ECF subfamily)